MGKTAFALKDSAKDSFEDAAVAVAGGEQLRVGDLLNKGKGTIVVDDNDEDAGATIDALNTVEALKQVPAKTSKKDGEQ